MRTVPAQDSPPVGRAFLFHPIGPRRRKPVERQIPLERPEPHIAHNMRQLVGNPAFDGPNRRGPQQRARRDPPPPARDVILQQVARPQLLVRDSDPQSPQLRKRLPYHAAQHPFDLQ
jgi:hypothetical protein